VTPAPRTPVLTRAARAILGLVGRVKWRAARTPILAVGGFGFLDAAAWTAATWAGLAAVGVSLLILEALSGETR
jgi:hypothetical protein